MLGRRVAPLAALALLAGLTAVAGPASASLRGQAEHRKVTICAEHAYEPVTFQGGQYILRNDNFGGKAECLTNSNQSANFTVTKSAADSHSPEAMAFPFLLYGCSYGLCTTDSILPAQVSTLRNARASWSINPDAPGLWNAAFDIWFGRTEADYKTQGNGGEVMVWLDTHDYPPLPVKPIHVAGHAWYVYHWTAHLGTARWTYVQFRAVRPVTSVHRLSLLHIIQRAVQLGLIKPSWWLLNIESGFEIWRGGQGLGTRSFSAYVRSSAPAPARS
jgi:hypothetical protein